VIPEIDTPLQWTGKRSISFDVLDVTFAVSRASGVPRSEIMGRSRLKGVAEARHLSWKMIRKRGWSYQQIADAFSVDHSSVQYGVKRSKAWA